MMKSSRFMLVPAFLIAGALFAQDAQVTPLMSKDLPEFPGKEGLMITVEYPPVTGFASWDLGLVSLVSV